MNNINYYNPHIPQVYINPQEENVALSDCGNCDCGACVEQIERNASVNFANIPFNILQNRRMHVVKDAVIIPVKKYFSIFNLEQGNLCILNNPGYNLLKQFGSPGYIREIIQKNIVVPAHSIRQFLYTLYTSGILVEAEQHVPNHKFPSSSDTLVIWLHLTNQCNLNCLYCYVEKSDEWMNKKTVKLALQHIFATAVSGGYKKVKLKYAGGEPTLHPDLLMYTHNRAETLAQKYQLELEGNILSNGVAIPDKLIEFSAARQIKWAISLDSINPVHNMQRPFLNGNDSLQAILKSLSKLLQYELSPYIPITVTRYNLQELPALVEFLLQRDLRFNINFYRHTPCDCKQDESITPDQNELISTLRKVYAVVEQNLPNYSLLSSLLDRVNLRTPHAYPCAAGHHYVSIGHRGNLAPCQMLVSQTMGVSLDTIQTVLPEFEDFSNPAVDEKKGCDKECPWRYYCAGGCPMQAFHVLGRYDMQSPYCKVYQELIPEIIYLEALRILQIAQPTQYQPNLCD